MKNVKVSILRLYVVSVIVLLQRNAAETPVCFEGSPHVYEPADMWRV